MISINNPGNERPSAKFKWQGEIGEVNGFVQFDTMVNGVRAYFKNLHAAMYLHGRTTIETYITAYAPPNENDTNRYIANMCDMTGLVSTQQIPTDPAFLCKFARAQFTIENGKTEADKISDDDIAAGLQAAEWDS
jgi:hypothetical protein